MTARLNFISRTLANVGFMAFAFVILGTSVAYSVSVDPVETFIRDDVQAVVKLDLAGIDVDVLSENCAKALGENLKQLGYAEKNIAACQAALKRSLLPFASFVGNLKKEIGMLGVDSTYYLFLLDGDENNEGRFADSLLSRLFVVVPLASPTLEQKKNFKKFIEGTFGSNKKVNYLSYQGQFIVASTLDKESFTRRLASLKSDEVSLIKDFFTSHADYPLSAAVLNKSTIKQITSQTPALEERVQDLVGAGLAIDFNKLKLDAKLQLRSEERAKELQQAFFDMERESLIDVLRYLDASLTPDDSKLASASEPTLRPGTLAAFAETLKQLNVPKLALESTSAKARALLQRDGSQLTASIDLLDSLACDKYELILSYLDIVAISTARSVRRSARTSNVSKTSPGIPVANKSERPRRNKLQQIVLGTFIYHDMNQEMPAAYTVDSNGTPTHSWRVLLMPYIGNDEEQARYQKIDLTSPWNSDANKELLKQTPEVYLFELDPSAGAQGLCDVAAVVEQPDENGKPRTLFTPGLKGFNKISVALAAATDGTSNTIAFVQRETPCQWADPTADMTIDEILDQFENCPEGKIGYWVVMFDGTSRIVSKETPREMLRAMLIPNDGDGKSVVHFFEYFSDPTVEGLQQKLKGVGTL